MSFGTPGGNSDGAGCDGYRAILSQASKTVFSVHNFFKNMPQEKRNEVDRTKRHDMSGEACGVSMSVCST
jgi:hypothetical protein